MNLALTHCPSCQGNLRELILHSGQHYSRIECTNCERFIRWGKSPSGLAKQQILEFKVRYLAAKTSLNGWEASFVASISQQLDNRKNLSPKQTGWLEKIYNKYA